MLAVQSATLGFAGVAAPLSMRTAAPVMETVDDLKGLAAAQKVPMGCVKSHSPFPGEAFCLLPPLRAASKLAHRS